MTSPIRIAVTGGGLAGASLVYSLLKFPHLDVHIFESAPAFKEAGMAIGLARNTLGALDLMGAAGCLERAGAVAMKGVRFMIAQTEGQGKIIAEVDESEEGKRLTSIVHRAALLQQLLADIPEERMHASKKLDSVAHQDSGSLVLRFVDGTTHECDVLVGADGIHSTVRKLILGAEDPAASPRNTGSWLVMTLAPYAEARASIGESIDGGDAREHGWIGNGTFLMHNILSEGQLVQLAIATEEAEFDPDQWFRVVTADEIKALFQGWPPHLVKGVDDLVCSKQEHKAFYLWEHPPARTYASGRMCVVGDAAHATTPWQGSGGGMSIEDSLILSSLLGHAKSAAEAPVALQVYDQVRRPRTQRIVESSRSLGTILTGRGEQTGLEMMAEGTLLRRWDFILDLDMGKHRDEAIEAMDVQLGADTVGK
ncbi:salicylate hydroxylase [Xylariomycetidae sp. FL2044]|nr:salicylate hydroxylase [Xylariomycetidae sp. FL2044]